MKNKKIKTIAVIIIIALVSISIIAILLKDHVLRKTYSNITGKTTGWIYDPGEEGDSINSYGGSSEWSNGLISSKSIAESASDSTGGASFGGFSMSKDSISSFSSGDTNLGFATGGAKTINNFRENIRNGYFPISTDITYNGLFYDYSFDTGNSKGKSDDLFYPSYSTAVSNDIISGKEEYYMSVGLNSNIKESDFKRKKLNLVVVLDNSGSMSSGFDSYYYDNNIFDRLESNKSKMEIANNSVNILLDQLNPDDRFGMVIFNSSGHIAKYLSEIRETDVKGLKREILNVRDMGGTNFEDGYRKALEILEDVDTNNDEYQNRIIVITDAMPNMGTTYSSDLEKMIEENSKKNIYTSFIGVGVDFNTEVVEKIGTVTGANYYSVHNEKEFKEQMGEDFDYMVTPLVFDLNLDFESEDYDLEAVYGTDVENNKKENIMHVNTLFPSKRNDDGEVKGGIILLKLKKKNNNDGHALLKVSYKDAQGKEHNNEQSVVFDKKGEYYDNTGIRKGIVLTRYANLMKDWILYERSNHMDELLIKKDTGIIYPYWNEEEIYTLLGENERTSVKLSVSAESKELFEKMKLCLEDEKKELNDETLDQEIEILDMLIKK